MVKSSGAELARRTRIVQAGIRTVLANLAASQIPFVSGFRLAALVT